MSATTRKVRLTLEIEVTAPVNEDHERALWTAGVTIIPTLPGVAFGLVEKVGVETEEERLSEKGVKSPPSVAQQATETQTTGASLVPSDTPVTIPREGRSPAESREMGLTLPIIHQFGIAFGLWGYSMDLLWNGKSQGENPDLVAVEESRIYAELLDAIETQEPTRVAKQEVAGRLVWVEEKPSNLYLTLRKAMFESYKAANEG